MKLAPVTKLDKRNKKKNIKKTDDDVMLENCDIIAHFFSQYPAIPKHSL